MTITAQHKDGLISIQLYGIVTDERLAAETQIAHHRANQMEREAPKADRPSRRQYYDEAA